LSAFVTLTFPSDLTFVERICEDGEDFFAVPRVIEAIFKAKIIELGCNFDGGMGF